MISVRNVTKRFLLPEGEITVLDKVSLDVLEEEFVCLLGYSGCGKSTLLRMIAGLESSDVGEIYADGCLHDKPSKDVFLLFQDFNQLFPWKTVKKNVEYAMRAAHVANKKDAAARADALLTSVGLGDFKNTYPHQLSGGMKQRAAVARALALQPKVLLMDEPFAALDMMTRANLQNLTRQICAQYHVTVIFVTHSVEEAAILGDRIAIMDNKCHGINRIITNRTRTEGSREDRMQLIGEIVSFLDRRMNET